MSSIIGAKFQYQGILDKSPFDAIKDNFCKVHDIDCNQKYDKILPYSYHLNIVFLQALLFKKQWDAHNINDLAIYFGIYGHDVIEDARWTYNNCLTYAKIIQQSYSDIDSKFPQQAADIIYACTEDKGKNRAERHGPAYYSNLMNNPPALFVKLCDMIANIKYSLLTNSSMFLKYHDEWINIKQSFDTQLNVHSTMVAYIDNLFKII